MILKDFSRIEGALNIKLLAKTHIIVVGAGGSYCLNDAFARSGIGKLTVLDFDSVDEKNITRQGYETKQIGKKKVNALQEHLEQVNSGLEFTGISKNFLEMNEFELNEIFGKADLFLFLTDSFKAQAFGNKLALKYKKPAVWSGYYEKSRCAEIVFTIPKITPACFRCAVSPRYKIQHDLNEEIKISSNLNTIFHSQLLDSIIGMITMAILHNDVSGYEFSNWFGNKWERNLIQLKVHPDYGTQKGSLFDRTFSKTEGRTLNFNTIFQKIEPEKPPKYELCPDCGGNGSL